MKYLLVGDPHITPSELEDGANLMNYALDIAKDKDATLVIMGDSFHTMNVLRLEVVDFWRSFYKLAKDQDVRVISLRGNHDSGGNLSALSTCEDLIHIVDDYYEENGILFASYTDNHQEFVTRSQKSDAKIMFTHLTFQGAKFENGFLAPDGLELSKVKQDKVYSGHIHCFSEDTEFLTDIGWRSVDNLDINQKAVGFNSNSGKLELTTINNIIKRVEEGPLFSIKSKHVDLLLTGGHRNIFFNGRNDDRQININTTEDLYSGPVNNIELPISGILEKEDMNFSDDQIRLIVWIATDGSFEDGAVRFHLKKERKITRLLALLDRMGAEYSNLPQKTGNRKIRIFKNQKISNWIETVFNCKNRRLPQFLRDLSPRQVHVLIEEYRHTDGNSISENVIQVITGKKDEADLLQELCVKSGITCTIKLKKGSTKYSIIKIILNKKTSSIVTSRNIKKTELINKNVWCIETGLGTLIARRNGKVTISGNCPQRIGKLQYIGAPRWRTISDANIGRALWLLYIENGIVKSEQPFETNNICKRIWLFEDTEANPVHNFDIEAAKDDDWRVDIKGSREYVTKRAAYLQELGAKVRTFIDQDKVIKIKESDGIDVALGKFIKDYIPKFGVDTEVLKDLVKSRLSIEL